MSIVRTKNGIYIEVYDGTTRIVDASDGLITASQLRFQTMYPGGIYSSASFHVPRPVVRQWAVKGAQRLVFRNGRTIVYEGKIDDLDRVLARTSQGITVTANGYWGALMNRRRWRKRWLDTRITDDIWVYDETGSGAELCLVDRNNRIRFTPKAEAWLTNEFANVFFTMPTGETVKRITFDFDLQEGGQNWQIALVNVQTASVVWSTSTSGTGSRDETLATPSQKVRLRFGANANQTPTSDGTYYGEFSNIKVYSETGAIDMQQAATDIIGEMSELNSSTALIGANTYTLEPLVFDRFETMAEILQYMGNIGDGSQNPWHAYLDHSETANTPDGNPVLATEQRPALTDYDYVVEVGRDIEPPLSVVRDFSRIRNWIVVEYVDERGFTQYVSPDDDANLTDSTSSTDYGQLDAVLSIGEATSTLATNFGRRFLARYKDPEWVTLSPINILSGIKTKGGNVIPSSQIRAGQRIKIANYLDPNLVFLISGTNYDDESEVTQITAGPLDFWFYNAFSHPPAMPEEVEAKEATGSSKNNKRNWYERLGYDREEWLSMSVGERYRIKQEWRKNKRGG